MLEEEMIIIIGKNKEHIRYVLRIFEKIIPVEVIDLNNLSDDVETKLNKSKNIYVMYKDDNVEFEKRWPNIKRICMNLTENLTEYYAHKTIRSSFSPFMKRKMIKLMNEITPEEDRSPNPFTHIYIKCLDCKKKELVPLEMARKKSPVCDECTEKRKNKRSFLS